MKPKPVYLVLLALAQAAQAESISVKFGSDDPTLLESSINTSSALPAGAIPVAGTYWNNAAGANGSATTLTDSTGATSGASVTWTSSNTWRSGSPGAPTATSQNAVLTKGYIDDSNNNHLVTFNNVPYLKYNVYFIGATDQTGYTSPAINGVNYTYTGTPGSGSTVAGNANWGNTPWSGSDTLTEGAIYLKIQNQTSTTLTVKGGPNAGNGYHRGSFAGVQIENTYAGTLSFWDIHGATAGAGGVSPSGNWSDGNWSNSAAGTAATGPWTADNAAVFAAGTNATGAYTVNLGGTQSADVVWVQEGAVTFSGGQLNLTGTGSLRAEGSASITASAPIGGTNINTVGSVTFNATNVYTGSTGIQSGTLLLNGGSAIPDSSAVSISTGASLLVNASETIGSLQGSGNIALDVNTLTVTTAGSTNYAGTFSGTGSVVFNGTGTQQLSGTSASYNGTIVAAAGVTLLPSSVANVFGTTTGTTTIQSGATLLLNGYNNSAITTPEDIHISGTGVGGAGAINGVTNYSVLRRISLDDNATINGTTRWDFGSGTAGQRAIIGGNNKILTKNGTNNIWFRGEPDGTSFTSPLAGLVINQGVFGVETSDNVLGSIPVTVNATGTFSAWTGGTNNTQNNPITLNGGTLDVDAGGITFGGTVTLTANSNINPDGGNMTVSGPIGESGGSWSITKTAGNTLTLSGTNTYSGSTTVNGGTLAASNGSALPDNSPLTLNGGSLLLNNSETIGTLTGIAGGTVNLGANTLTINQAADGVLLGAVSGTGSIVKGGSGRLVLNADNSLTGSITLNAGTLQLGGLNPNTPLVVGTGAGLRVGPIAGPASTTRTVKSASLAADSQSTYRIGASPNWDTLQVLDLDGLSTGGTHTIHIEAASGIAPGTYELIQYDGAIGGSGYTFVLGSMPHLNAILVNNAANSSVDLQINAIENLLWKGSIGGNPDSDWDTNNKETWVLESNPSNAEPFYTSDNVIFNDTSTNGTVNVVGSVSPGSITINNSTTAYVIGGDPISGSATVSKDGNGTATFTNANTFTGLTTVTNGILAIGNGTSGSFHSAAQIQIDGGELQFNPATGSTIANPVLINAGGTCSVKGSGDINFNVSLTNASTGSLVFDRAGTVYCNAANQSAGTITIQSGTVAVDGNQINDRFANNKVVTVNTGGTLAILGVNAIPGGTVNSIDPVINGGTFAVVTGGSPAIGAGGQSHAHIRNLTLTGGTVLFAYSGAGSAYNGESFQLNGTLTVNGSAPSVINYGSGATDANSGLAIQGDRTFDVGNVTGDANADLTINAEVENPDGGGGALTKANDGTMVLNGNNTYTGNTTINGGVLEIGAAGYLYNAGYTNSPIITVNTGGTLRLIRFDYGSAGGTGQLADYRERRVLNGGTIEITGASHSSGNDFTVGANGGTFRYTPAGQTLSLNGNNNTDILTDGALVFETTGNIQVAEVIGGTGSLVKTGAATLTLSAPNSYAGGTTVTTGTLLVTNTTGSATGSGAVTVTNGGTLAGNGSVAGSVSVATDGNLSPGTSAGILTIGGDLDISAQAAGAGILHFELDALAATSDKIAVTGTLSVGTQVLGFSDFSFTNLGGLEAGTYKLITGGAPVNGSLDPANLTGTIGSFNATIQINGNDLELVVSTTGSPFATWIAGFPQVGTENGLNDDPDDDGKPNFLEFALNSHPANGNSNGKVYMKLATVGGNPGVLTLTTAVRNGASFTADGNNQKAVVAADSLTYTIQAANVLTDWGSPVVTEVTGDDATAIQSGLPALDAGWTYHSFRTDGSAASDPADFIRVKVTTP